MKKILNIKEVHTVVALYVTSNQNSLIYVRPYLKSKGSLLTHKLVQIIQDYIVRGER